MRGGFTLTEVVVALVILELGLLGVAGLALQTYGTLSDASLRSRAVAAVEEVADSLVVTGVRTGGTRSFAGGTVSWTLGAAVEGGTGSEGLLRISIGAAEPGGDGIFTVHGIMPVGGASGAP